MKADIAESECIIEVDEFDLDLRLGSTEISDEPIVEIHASASCTCSHNKSCSCYSCSCSCSCGCDNDY
jgi:hypothetical protein